MIRAENGVLLVECAAEMPPLPPRGATLYMDFETSSGDPRLDSLNPWHHCAVAGAGIAYDDSPVWFVHVSKVGKDALAAWVRGALERVSVWENQNVKYDAQVAGCDLGVLVPLHVELRCTLTHAKVFDSDRLYSGGYGLDAVAKVWLHEDIDRWGEAMHPYLHRNKDYGAVPWDILGAYGGQDVATNRRLATYLTANTPEDVSEVMRVERGMTRVLYDMERRGMRVDPTELAIAEMSTITRMLKLEEELNQLVGRSFRPHVGADCFEVLCVQYGLPVLGWTEKNEPSFDKHAMAAYSAHPLAPQPVVQRIAAYRKLNTLLTFFVTKFQELHIDGLLHSDYNQLVRTGRLSCKNPNSQQNPKYAKELLHPREGHAFISIDYSQIEFRYIVHYIQDAACIAAYNENPDTDFHAWVAEMVGISRKPAKTMNFMMGYGAGKKKTIKVVSANGEVVGDVLSQVADLPEHERKAAFDRLCERKALSVFDRYHATLPGLRITSRKAASIAAARGFVRTMLGRRRHLPTTHAHLAFNSLCQGSAADLQKERTVAVAEMLRGTDIHLVGLVHDESLFEAPIEIAEDPRTQRDLIAVMEDPARPLRVPVRCTIGTSRENWREAGDGAPLVYDRTSATNLLHCRK